MDNITLETNRIIVSTFFVLDKNNKKRFFKKNFLLVNVKLDVMLKILLLTMSNTDINFQAWNL